MCFYLRQAVDCSHAMASLLGDWRNMEIEGELKWGHGCSL